MPDEPERHPHTKAAKTTTDLANATVHARTTQQVLAEQQNPTKPSSPPPRATVPAVVSASAVTINQDKLDQWSSLPQISINFNGNTGALDALDGSKVIGRRYVGLVPRITKGFTRFHGPGVQPDVAESCLSDATPAITRDELGDLDPTKWEYFGGEQRDPWQPHMCLPLIAHDESGDLYQFVARNKVGIFAIQQLLGRYRHHPRGKAGMLPVIQIDVVNYFNKKFKTDKPKPVLTIVDWINRDGTPATSLTTPPLPKLSDEMSDEIPF